MLSLNPEILKILHLGKLIWIIFAALIIIPLQLIALAELSYDINIPSGSADKDSPFHWSSEKDGNTSGFIEIIVGDVVNWKNGDTVFHTVTSGTSQDGPNGMFDSGDIGPGQFFVQKFTEVGEFQYYCTIHPWRAGVVSVISGLSVLPNVGIDAGDGKVTFDVEYKFNRLVNSASIDETAKSILFELKGNTINDDNTLTLFLPSALISGISSVSIDDTVAEEFSQDFEDEITILTIKDVPPNAKSLTLVGTTIVPEFGAITIVILGIAIVSVVAISVNSKIDLR